jgi:hypothetical protein
MEVNKLSDLVKTGYTIEDEMRRGRFVYDREGEKKYLILPQGLDKLDDLLKILFLLVSNKNMESRRNKMVKYSSRVRCVHPRHTFSTHGEPAKITKKMFKEKRCNQNEPHNRKCKYLIVLPKENGI